MSYTKRYDELKNARQSYLAFLDLMLYTGWALSNSASVQEETTILGVSCLTLRENIERPVTITDGMNEIVGANPEKINELSDGRAFRWATRLEETCYHRARHIIIVTQVIIVTQGIYERLVVR